MRTLLQRLAPLCLAALLLPSARVARSADCNQNGVDDEQDIALRTSRDCNLNSVPDECELEPGKVTFELPRLIHDDGSNHYSWLADDFDGDGDVDIATAGQDIRVVLNQGQGEFEEPDVYPLGDWRRWDLVGGDLNGDGFPDLVATSHSTGEVPVLLNQGDGTFSLRVEQLVPFGAIKPRLADFDGDGNLDLASTGAQDMTPTSYLILGDLYWHRNRGDGTFEEVRILTPVETAGGILARDLNGDGAVDIAVNERSGRDETAGETAVLLNHGDGTFAEPSRYPVGLRPSGPLAADLDSNGSLDLVVLNRLSNTLSILWNQGDGTYGEPETVPTGLAESGSKSLHVGDLDGDGDTDLLVTADWSRTEPAELAFFLNDGDGTFQATVNTDLSGWVYEARAADVTGDGLPEILMTGRYSTNALVWILENQGDGRFEPLGSFQNEGGYEMEVLDIDGDSDPDIVLDSYYGAQYLENVTGALELQQGCDPFLRGDVNADGVVSVADLVMLRRYLFAGKTISCRDAGDVTDDEIVDLTDVIALLQILFLSEDWPLAVPAPYTEPDLDPTVSAVRNEWNQHLDLDMEARVGCSEYSLEPAQETGDLIRLGDVTAPPGAEVGVPVYITSSVPVEAVQIVLEHEPGVLEIIPDSLSYEGTFFEEVITEEPPHDKPEVSILTVHPEAGIATVAIAGRLVFSDRSIPPGSDTLIAWIGVRVPADASPGTTLTLQPTNGPAGDGVGPHFLRNEITFEGAARLVSTIPELEGSILRIVMDQLFMRGDSNQDTEVNISDAIFTLHYLFSGESGMTCLDSADVDDTGEVNITDAVNLLSFLYLGGPPPGEPLNYCGSDPTADRLRCRSHSACE